MHGEADSPRSHRDARGGAARGENLPRRSEQPVSAFPCHAPVDDPSPARENRRVRRVVSLPTHSTLPPRSRTKPKAGRRESNKMEKTGASKAEEKRNGLSTQCLWDPLPAVQRSTKGRAYRQEGSHPTTRQVLPRQSSRPSPGLPLRSPSPRVHTQQNAVMDTPTPCTPGAPASVPPPSFPQAALPVQARWSNVGVTALSTHTENGRARDVGKDCVEA